MDPRERDDMRVDDDDRSVESEQADKMQKLGEITDEDLTDEEVGGIVEITHDKKVTKEFIKLGEGKRLKIGYKAFIKYKAYFFTDHVIFEQTGDDPVELNIGDNSWPDGVQTGVEKMRKGEISKIRIKPKHGFGRPLRVEELNFPKGWEEGEKRKRLTGETIIYEVELVDYVRRQDLEANGNFLKYLDEPAESHEWETPKDQDEIVLDIDFRQGDRILYSKQNWSTTMHDDSLTLTMRKVIESMKRGECSRIEIKA